MMTSGDTIGISGILLTFVSIVAEASTKVAETTKHFYEIPIEWLCNIDILSINLVLATIFLAQGIILRSIKIKKEYDGNDTEEE
jgi:hypothetical protein